MEVLAAASRQSTKLEKTSLSALTCIARKRLEDSR